jgi:hypothetical protein
MGAIEEYKARNAAREAQRAEQKKAPKKEPWWFNQPLAIDRFTGWLQLYTLLLVIVTVGSVWVLNSTDEKVRESYSAVQRPFVTAKELVVDTNHPPGYWSFGIRFENSGNTPTQGMQFVPIANLLPPDDPEPWFQTPPPPFSRFTGLLGPKATDILQGTNVGLPIAAIDKMAEARSNYYFRGVIKYRDFFKETDEHVTKYCFAFIPYKEGKELKFGVQRCLYWNCADEECKKDRERYDAALKEANKQPTPPSPPR